MRSPRRSAMRAAAARGECFSWDGVDAVSMAPTLAQRRNPVLQARERTQRLRLRAEAGARHHVLRLVEADPGERTVQTILIGEVPTQRRRVAPRQLELR